MGSEWHLAEFVDESLDVSDATTIVALGEMAARRSAEVLTVLRAGRDADVPELVTPIARRLRQTYGDVWRTWLKVDLECDFGWGLADINTEPDEATRGLALRFSLERWWGEVGTTLHTEYRRAVTLVARRRADGTLDRRKHRSNANKILSTIRLEADGTQRAFLKG